MKISTPIKATELKKELIAFGIKVLMCKQGSNGGALVCISNNLGNQDLFVDFCNTNSYAMVCGISVHNRKSTSKHIDYGNIFKFI